MFKVCARKSVFDIEGRKTSGEIVKGLTPKLIDSLVVIGIIEPVDSTPKTSNKGKQRSGNSE